MCQIVFLPDRNIHSKRQLAELIGKENLVFLTQWPDKNDIDDCCLCWIDVEASAKKAGWDAEWDDFGFKLSKKGHVEWDTNP